MNKKNLAKYISLFYEEEKNLLKDKDWRDDWDTNDFYHVNSVFKSVPFWDPEFIFALYLSNKENLEENNLTEENIVIPEKKDFRVDYSVRENQYINISYETTIDGYSEEHVRSYMNSSDFDWWSGDEVDRDILDSDVSNYEIDNIEPIRNNVNESKTEENPYGECNFSAKEFINCVQNHSDLETLYMMKSIIDEEIERFEKMISIAQNLDREPIGFKINKS
jgi:hypothetical protein